MNKNLGALPPQNLSWQIGKTAATIKFVKEAEEYIKNQSMSKEVKELQNFVGWLKSGYATLNEFITVEDFMNG